MSFRFILVFFLFVHTAFAQPSLLRIQSDLEQVNESGWMNLSTLVRGKAASGGIFSRADSLQCYGIGYEHTMAPSLHNPNLKINIAGNFKSVSKGNTYQLVFMISRGDSLLYWTASDIGNSLADTNWTALNYNYFIPANLADSMNTLKTFVWNTNCRGAIDADDFEINFYELKLPSYVPTHRPVLEDAGLGKVICSNNYFSIYFNDRSGTVAVANNTEKKKVIINRLTTVLEYRTEKKDSRTEIQQSFEIKSVDSLHVALSAKSSIAEQLIEIFPENNFLRMSCTTRIQKNISVIRDAIEVEFSQPFSEAISAFGFNTQHPKEESWLAREGFASGEREDKIIIYHPEVSSIQIDPLAKRAIFNLDYSADHPMIHFPELDSSKNKFIDYSESDYKSGDAINGSISFYKSPLESIPVLSRYPFGYSSAMCWTEHADFSSIKTHRAIYFGADTITRIENAVGGFSKWNIPVTKSVFFSNPTHELLAGKHAGFKEESANYSDTKEFKDFLQQLYKSGVEVCLHTPDPFTTTRKQLELALKTMKADFNSHTWIDHGYDNSPRSNREDLNCDGFDSSAKNFSADLWKKYDIQYFWNSFFEDSSVYNAYSFNAFFSKPYHGYGNVFPTPVYWKHPTRTGDVYHWRTTSTTDPTDPSMWNYYFSKEKLNDLVHSHGAEFVHFYGPRVDSTNGYYHITPAGIFIDEKFNELLKTLSVYRDQKKIWLTTVNDFLDYQRLLDRITFSFTPEGMVDVLNTNSTSVKGITFFVSPGMYSIRLPDKSIISSQSSVIQIDELPAGQSFQLIPLVR